MVTKIFLKSLLDFQYSIFAWSLVALVFAWIYLSDDDSEDDGDGGGGMLQPVYQGSGS